MHRHCQTAVNEGAATNERLTSGLTVGKCKVTFDPEVYGASTWLKHNEARRASLVMPLMSAVIPVSTSADNNMVFDRSRGREKQVCEADREREYTLPALKTAAGVDSSRICAL